MEDLPELITELYAKTAENPPETKTRMVDLVEASGLDPTIKNFLTSVISR